MRITNWKKKIKKTADNHLGDGEEILATLVLAPRGTMKRVILLGAVTGAAAGTAGRTSPVAINSAGRASAQVGEAMAHRNSSQLSAGE